MRISLAIMAVIMASACSLPTAPESLDNGRKHTPVPGDWTGPAIELGGELGQCLVTSEYPFVWKDCGG